jgi:predicted enzyme related to lactoylglutathione lyase
MSFVMDPSGAPVALWQANQHIGATLVNEPGTLNWNELVTSDQAVFPFYSAVTGLTAESMDMGEGEPYTVFKAGEAMVGGSMPPQMPGVPSHWHVYFGTDDADATAAKAAELGGSVIVPPFDTPVGRISILSDPQGAMFSVIKTTPA